MQWRNQEGGWGIQTPTFHRGHSYQYHLFISHKGSMKKQKKLENVAINDILPLKSAGRYAIADAKWFGVPGRLHSLCRAILFGSHQCNLPPPVWQSLRFPFAVCNAWQQSRKENLRRVVENSGSIFTRLWTEVHEIFRRCRRPFVLSNTIT